ncbi:MAG: hypothetical protein GX075_04015, partial [Firmicutes bacterium]|nr:hypothetical protein [Bacillota bacterium]
MAFLSCALIISLVLTVFVFHKDFKEYYPTLIFSALVAVISDLFGIVSNQWIYHGPTVGGLSLWSVLGIAPAEGGLFIRLFPKSENRLIKAGYWVGWALLNTFGEWFFVQAGWIEYIKWNSWRAFLYYLFFFGAVWFQE